MGSKQKTPSGRIKSILPTFCILISAPFIGCRDQGSTQIENDAEGSSQYELALSEPVEYRSLAQRTETRVQGAKSGPIPHHSGAFQQYPSAKLEASVLRPAVDPPLREQDSLVD